MTGTRPISRAELEQLVSGGHGHPHGVLGPHLHEGAVTVRVLKPLASSVNIVYGDESVPLEHEHAGVWVGVLPGPGNGTKVDVPDYRVRVDYGQEPVVVDDPYRFLPTLGEVDLHLINEGRHEELWQALGARVHHYETPLGGTVSGTSFAVWAPSARGVRIKGSFNDWDSRAHPMRQLGESGVWELFVPDIGTGARYKFEILGFDGEWREKADPMAFHTEIPPATASVVFESTYTWGDEEWMATRAARAARPGGDVGLRDAPRLLAEARWRDVDLCRDRRRAHPVPDRPRVHARRVPPGDGAPVRRVLGLPGHVVLRPDRAVRRPRRISGTSSTGCTRPGSA